MMSADRELDIGYVSNSARMLVMPRPRSSTGLVPLTPIGQLRAGRLAHRLTQLIIGLLLYGFALALIIKGALGVSPWDVLHQGIARHIHISYGVVVIAASIAVLLFWIPLRQWPGLGTILNAILVGVSVDIGLAVLATPQLLWERIGFLVVGLVLNGFAGAVYIGAQLGPGARDGLMTGLVARTGLPIWVVRTGIEGLVVVGGFLLGGDLWIGTVAYAVGIGPLPQFFLPLVIVRLSPLQIRMPENEPAVAVNSD
jgi:uncharacterized membrane protein YczE